MKIFIVLPVLLIVMVISVHGQQTTEKFYYKKLTKSSKAYQTLVAQDSFNLEKTGKVKNRIITRKMVAAEKNYTHLFYKKDKKVELRSGDDQVLGSYKITSKAKNDIIIPNGVVYDWQKGKSSREWRYSVNGTEVMNCKFFKEDGKKYLQYNILNPNAPDFSNAFLISKVYGADLIQAKASAPAVYGGAIAGTVIIGLLNYAQPDPTPKVN